MEVKRTCQRCGGDGIWPNPYYNYQGELVDPDNPGPCPYCDGEGLIEYGVIELPSNIFDSYIILEELDTTEYNALTDTQKSGVEMLLMCGKVDLNTGKAGRVRLWNWFGAESTTVANLTALLE